MIVENAIQINYYIDTREVSNQLDAVGLGFVLYDSVARKTR